MTNLVYYYVLVVLFFNINDATKPDNPLHGTNSICADVCTPSEAHVELDLSQARIYRENERVEIKFQEIGSGRCRQPGT
ncbi:unnamed protein product [Rotaria magnacalcarata]|uniref:Uncharacterized protein n=1 Tax=Rotaria magnacalcarata TaxID=392030 RepID=A0A8S2LY07_9BILA|nr:unnamed protein product [Rotaria magnacalcarata]